MSALDELLAPCNFPPCDPLRGEAVRELEALRAELTASRRAPSPAVRELVAVYRELYQRAMDGENIAAHLERIRDAAAEVEREAAP